MKPWVYGVIGAAAGIAFVLFGIWLGGLPWQRGLGAELTYVLCCVAACGGFTLSLIAGDGADK